MIIYIEDLGYLNTDHIVRCGHIPYAGYDLYIQNIEGELNWVNKKGLKTYSMSDGSTSGFTIGDILRNNWKLYQLIDGKMVDYVEHNTIGCSDGKIRLDPLDVWRIWPPVEAKMGEIVTEATGGSIPRKYNLADFTIEKTFDALKEHARNQTKDIKAFMNADGDLIDNPLYQKEEYIMQPIEAIRWMRENLGKVIVAVEDERVKLKAILAETDKGTPNRPNPFHGEGFWNILLYFPKYEDQTTWGDGWKTSHIFSELTFLAYTYKELKE